MRRIMVKLLLVMTLAFPVFVQAQDVTEEPPPTVESFETPTAPPTETSTPEPTVTPAPTETPVPVPPVEPIDQAKVFESIFTFAVVLVVGLVLIFFAVVVGLFRLFSPAVQAILLGGIKVGVDEAGKVADRTETPIDNVAVAELRKLVERLEAELRATQDQVTTNAADIATTNRAVSQAISRQ